MSMDEKNNHDYSTEIWKTATNGFSKYAVSNKGRVKSTLTNRIKTPTLDKTTGYMKVTVYDDEGNQRSKSVHLMVAQAFIPNPENKRVVNHKDTDKTNNNVWNLEWATDSENMLHAFRNGLCENTRSAAYDQIKRLHAMPKTERQRESARENIIKINKRPKTEKQLEAATIAINSKACRERAMESHYNRNPPIRIVETGEIFRSQKELADTLGVNQSSICAVLKGRQSCSIKGLHFEYVDDEPVENEKPKKEPGSILYDFQYEAVERAFNGCIFNGGTGTGKSRTGLYFYFKEQGGSYVGSDYIPMINPKNLYIITPAVKRDKGEWSDELSLFRLSEDPKLNYYKNTVVVDSWNNINKYIDVTGAYFIFDECKINGGGAWTKAFLKITKSNNWIMLSATAGDRWIDYWPVFVANGFYKNKTDFMREHVIFSRYSKFPQVDRYINTQRLERLRNRILIDMTVQRHTVPHHEDVYCNYDIPSYKEVFKKRWDPYKDEPLKQASELCYVLRKIVNSDESRQVKLLELLEDHPKAIIFYSYDYERDILMNLGYSEGTQIAEWTGHKHEPVPESEKWVYLVNYASGAEGFCCISTDTVIFYSQTYSYTSLVQACGRVDRLNTNFIDLYYYHLKSRSGIDLAISRALKEKKKFNEQRWVNSWK